jgi:NADPH-dependent F420 reductase
MPEQVTVIGGTGALGAGVALRLAVAGIQVVIGSRNHQRARVAAGRVREQTRNAEVRGLENGPAAEASDVVFLCVPFRNQSETLTNLKEYLRAGQLVVDATVPLAAAVSGRATRVLGVWQGSAAQQAAEMVPDGVRVVAALHTVNAPALSDLSQTLDEDVLVCGDRREDKAHAASYIERIPGLRCVDAGRLEMARIAEALTALLIGVNARYKTHAGVKLTGLSERPW